MKLITRYISLPVFGGLILPLYTGKYNFAGKHVQKMALHTSSAKNEILSGYFYEDVIEKMVPTLKK